MAQRCHDAACRRKHNNETNKTRIIKRFRNITFVKEERNGKGIATSTTTNGKEVSAPWVFSGGKKMDVSKEE